MLRLGFELLALYTLLGLSRTTHGAIVDLTNGETQFADGDGNYKVYATLEAAGEKANQGYENGGLKTDKAKGKLESLKEFLHGGADVTKEKAKESYDDTTGAAQSGVEYVKDKAGQGLDAASEKSNEVYQGVKDTAAQGVDAAQTKVREGYDAATGAAQAGAEFAKTKVEQGLNAASEKGKEAYHGVKDTADAAQAKVHEGVNAVKNAAQSGADFAKAKASQGYDAAAEKGKDTYYNAKDTAAQGADAAKAKAHEGYANAQDAAHSGMKMGDMGQTEYGTKPQSLWRRLFPSWGKKSQPIHEENHDMGKTPRVVMDLKMNEQGQESAKKRGRLSRWLAPSNWIPSGWKIALVTLVCLGLAARQLAKTGAAMRNLPKSKLTEPLLWTDRATDVQGGAHVTGQNIQDAQTLKHVTPMQDFQTLPNIHQGQVYTSADQGVKHSKQDPVYKADQGLKQTGRK
jgi:hypothetical protein